MIGYLVEPTIVTPITLSDPADDPVLYTAADGLADVLCTLNPFLWFRYGVQLAIIIPFTVLRWLGIELIPEASSLRRKTVLKVATAVTATTAFVASMVTIVQGWDKTVTLVKSLIFLLRHR